VQKNGLLVQIGAVILMAANRCTI